MLFEVILFVIMDQLCKQSWRNIIYFDILNKGGKSSIRLYSSIVKQLNICQTKEIIKTIRDITKPLAGNRQIEVSCRPTVPQKLSHSSLHAHKHNSWPLTFILHAQTRVKSLWAALTISHSGFGQMLLTVVTWIIKEDVAAWLTKYLNIIHNSAAGSRSSIIHLILMCL